VALSQEGDSKMAVSRYSSDGGAGSNIPAATNQSTSSTAQGSSSTQSSGGSSTVSSVNQQNMDAKSLEALNKLIAQLLGGGTAEMGRQSAERAREIQNVTAQRSGYSREAALADAQGAMSQQLRQVMEKLLPSITRAAEGSGTSQNSMRALMLQDAATRAAESSAALGLDAVSKYGNIGATLSGVLEALTRPNDPAAQALLNALNVAKGAVTTGTQTSDTSNWGVQNTQSQQSQQSNQDIYRSPSYATTTQPYSNQAVGGDGIYGYSMADSDRKLNWDGGSGSGGIYASLAEEADPWTGYSDF